MTLQLNPVDRVEVLTLQDNYLDVVAQDNSEVVRRVLSHPNYTLRQSIRAEHGFSLLVTVERDGIKRSLLFDFGYSEDGARHNAQVLGVDLGQVEAAALSHGHFDHSGGMSELLPRLSSSAKLVLHPAAYRDPRYVKKPDGGCVTFPPLLRENLQQLGITPAETRSPRPLLDGTVGFLGEIARVTDFEAPGGNMFYEENGEEHLDRFEDDTGLVIQLRDKGLVVISGCAHAGIINTVRHAQTVTGEKRVHAVMGGFHLTGMDRDRQIAPTVETLRAIGPDVVVPAHCTGRTAQQDIESALPDAFVLNMVGTTLNLAARP
jgi:7,8-dihydropterin-6-yl-methyl-4-(beta-D-ribofuranosyl)aminobenzene 5'-phosphate synthase